MGLRIRGQESVPPRFGFRPGNPVGQLSARGPASRARAAWSRGARLRKRVAPASQRLPRWFAPPNYQRVQSFSVSADDGRAVSGGARRCVCGGWSTARCSPPLQPTTRSPPSPPHHPVPA